MSELVKSISLLLTSRDTERLLENSNWRKGAIPDSLVNESILVKLAGNSLFIQEYPDIYDEDTPKPPRTVTIPVNDQDIKSLLNEHDFIFAYSILCSIHQAAITTLLRYSQ